MKVALGGERVGSGNKMNLHLRNYERSSHNLSRTFKSPMGVGILTPCYCNVALRGDKFDIKLAAGARTIPSKGALFGSYKLQVDYYLCPVRLYTGILHNNPVNIGLNMKNVYFPKMRQGGYFVGTENEILPWGFAKNSLLHMLGLSGLGNIKSGEVACRTFNAIPILAYYDIFKNYYSNKQEEKAHVISTEKVVKEYGIDVQSITGDEELDWHEVQDGQTEINVEGITKKVKYSAGTATITAGETGTINIEGAIGLNPHRFYVKLTNTQNEEQSSKYIPVSELPAYFPSVIQVTSNYDTDIEQSDFIEITFDNTEGIENRTIGLAICWDIAETTYENRIKLTHFDLKNIDNMRSELLSHHTMGEAYLINNFENYPYATVAQKLATNSTNWSNNNNLQELNGLMLKTYQSDIFNNWLSSEYIDGINGIANITKVSTEGGGFTIDSLNYAEKMYDLLNRVVVSGNTYEDWQDVVYENTPKRHLESPMYLGGLSQEIVFEEIVSTAVTEGGTLGQMGGRGISRHRKGGHIRVKVDEASFIIGIASITPRLNYGQGNDFFFTDIETADDFHKPALDGIGFQDLIGERMAYFDTIVNEGEDDITRHVVGKLPAWIEYMTDVDRVHGDFADEDSENSWMVLNRNYEFDKTNRCIKDATTYVEPEKYNYAFAYTALDSQNFWVQIEHNIIARRKMSAKQIPNI